MMTIKAGMEFAVVDSEQVLRVERVTDDYVYCRLNSGEMAPMDRTTFQVRVVEGKFYIPQRGEK